MTPKDWTLLAIAAAKSEPLQPVQLQKSLFLLSENLTRSQLRVDEFYIFRAHDYGPFCSDVYFDADVLCGEGLVRIDRPSGSSYRLYYPTDEGQKKASELRSSLDPTVSDYLDRIIPWVCSLSFRQLVTWIYQRYPQMKANSVFKE